MDLQFILTTLILGGIVRASNWGKLSQTWGKNIVFYIWKGIQCFRIYAVPSYTNTPVQKAQRLMFKIIMNQGLDLLAPVLQKFWKKVAIKMTELNKFMSVNLLHQASPPTKDMYVVSVGNLYMGIINTAVLNVAKTVVAIAFETDIGYNGAATDKIVGVIYDTGVDEWFVTDIGGTRSVGTINVTVPGNPVATNLYAYIFAYRDLGTADEIISDSNKHSVSQAS